MKKYFLIAAIILLVAGGSIIITRFFDSKLFDKKISPSGDYLIYNKNGVKVYENPYIQMTMMPLDNMGAENYVYAKIEDGEKRAMYVLERNPDASVLVQAVNDDYIILPIITQVGTIDSVFIANRNTREVKHYPMFQTDLIYVAFTNDAQKMMVMDYINGQLVLMDADRKEIQRLFFSEKENGRVVHTGGSASPDNSKIAFFTTNDSYENPDFGIFVYNIKNNSVEKIGKTTNAGQIVWKDNNIFVNIVKNVENGVEAEQEREKFTVK